jgi:hypothetical protein
MPPASPIAMLFALFLAKIRNTAQPYSHRVGMSE